MTPAIPCPGKGAGHCLVSALLLASCASTRAALPPTRAEPPLWRTVHVDHVDPSRVPIFEAARREWLHALDDAGLSDGRGYFLKVGASTFYTLRAFGDFAALDRVRAERRIAPELPRNN